VKPLIVYGDSNKSRYQYAFNVAQENGWVFVDIPTKAFHENLRKSSITSTLLDTLKLYFLDDIDMLKSRDAKRLLDDIKDSPHRFIFSTGDYYHVEKVLKRNCRSMELGDDADPFKEVWRMLMNEPDRMKALNYIENSEFEVGQLLHILKNNVWQNLLKGEGKAFKGVETCLQNLYKVDDSLLLSMLVFSFPLVKIPITFRKRDVAKERALAKRVKELKVKYNFSTFEALEAHRVLEQVKDVKRIKRKKVMKKSPLTRWI